MAWRQSRSTVSVASGGKSSLLGDGPAGDAEGCDEWYPVGIAARLKDGVEHEGPDGIVAAQVSPDFLEHEFRGFGAQDGARSTLVGFQFIERRLDLPPLRISCSQLDR